VNGISCIHAIPLFGDGRVGGQGNDHDAAAGIDDIVGGMRRMAADTFCPASSPRPCYLVCMYVRALVQ
jgi:hypothetical protein